MPEGLLLHRIERHGGDFPVICRILSCRFFFPKKRFLFQPKKKVSASIMQVLHPFIQEKAHLCKKRQADAVRLFQHFLYRLSIRDVPGGIGVQFHTRRVTRQVLVIPLCADHGAVVAAQLQRRQI